MPDSPAKHRGSGRRPDFSLVSNFKTFGYQIIVGLDEVGRGAIAGPIVVAAVSLNIYISGINDSKLLSRAKREELAKSITKSAKILQIGSASVQEIDSLGITKAQELAYERALKGIEADLFLTDFYNISKRPFLKAVKGDRLFYHVAAASIVAKVSRDLLMQRLSNDFPGYAWHSNAGYGTEKHFAGIKKGGLTPHHRKSFL